MEPKFLVDTNGRSYWSGAKGPAQVEGAGASGSGP